MENFSNAVGNFHHYNPHTGLLCNCQWGAPDPYRNSRVASQAVRAIRNQNQKRFRTPHGTRFLNALERYVGAFPEAESLAAWLASRYKHNDIELTDNSFIPVDRDTGEGSRSQSGEFWHPDADKLVDQNGTDIRRTLPSWIQWMNARQHPLRRGVNIMEKSPQEITDLARQLQTEVAEKQEKSRWFKDYEQTGKHAHTFTPDDLAPDADEVDRDILKKYAGYKVHSLHTNHDLEGETGALGHCIGFDGQNYKRALENGSITAYSLRDRDGYPKVTWHYNPDESLAHVQGKSGTPKDDYRHLITLFNEKNGLDDDAGGSGHEDDLDEELYDDEIQYPDPEDVEDYISQYHPDGTASEYAHEYGNYGENTELRMGDPKWENIFHDLKEKDPKTRHDFYQTVLYNTGDPRHETSLGSQHHANGWHKEVESFAALHPNDKDLEDDQIVSEWRNALQGSYHPLTGDFTSPQAIWGRGYLNNWQTAWHQTNQPLFSQGEYQDELKDNTGENPTYLGTDPVENRQFQSNILDPIHDTLDGRVFDDPGGTEPRLKQHHKHWIEREIYDVAKKFHPNPEQWLNLVLTGSLTTYQYSNDSDVDISLFVNPNMMPEWKRDALIGLMVENIDGKKLPGTPYPLQAFVVAKNISAHDLYQMGLRSGYDLTTRKWLVPPERSRARNVEKEYNTDYVYALESADKMERLLRYDPDKAVDYWHQIHKRRMRDQSKGKGDYSQANIVYKFLASRGLLPEIAQVSGEYIASIKTADKLNDFLGPRPDLQTPEAQQWLGYLGQVVQRYPKVDPMTPWLTREWKKGRLQYGPESNHPTFQIPDQRVGIPEHMNTPQTSYLNPQNVSHWADWYGSNHPTRRGVDIMQLKMPDMHQKINDWDSAMAAESEEQRKMNDPDLKGEVVHAWPDGWSLQKLTHPSSLEYEGDTMGHCVGSYANDVRQGNTLIYSLRDPKNAPHVTTEITPNKFEPIQYKPWDMSKGIEGHPVLRNYPPPHRKELDKLHNQFGHLMVKDLPDPAYHNTRTPEEENYGLYHHLRRTVEPEGPTETPLIHNGEISQIQGQGNTIPKPEYQARMKEFFNTIPEEDRPTWPSHTFDKINDLDDDMGGYYPHGDYGVKDNSNYDWQSLMEDAARNPDHDTASRLVNLAQTRGQLKEFQEAQELARERMRDDYLDYGPNGMYGSRDFPDDDVAEWAGLDKDDYYRLDPEDAEMGYEPEFDERKWQDDLREHRENYAQEQFDNSFMGDWFHSLDDMLWDAQRNPRQAKSLPLTHKHFTTGEPCSCTFAHHPSGLWD